jgi:hypothetical protein
MPNVDVISVLVGAVNRSKGRYDQGRHMWHTKNVYGSVCIFQEELIDGTWRFVDHPDDFEYIYKHAPANVITVTE